MSDPLDLQSLVLAPVTPVDPGLPGPQGPEWDPTGGAAVQHQDTDFFMQLAAQQAQGEEAARVAELDAQRKQVFSERARLFKEASRLRELAAREEGQNLRQAATIDSQIARDYARAQNQAARDRAVNEWRNRVGNRNASLRASLARMTQDEINKRFEAQLEQQRALAAAGARSGRGRGAFRWEGQDSPVSTEIARIARDGLSRGAGGEVFNEWGRRRQNLNFSSTPEERQEQTFRLWDEYARNLVTEATRLGGQVSEEEARQRVFNAAPPWAQEDIRAVQARMQEPDFGQGPGGDSPMLGPSPSVTTGEVGGFDIEGPRAPGVTRAEAGAGIPTQNVDGLRRRAEELEAAARQLELPDPGEPVPLVPRTRQIAIGPGSMGPAVNLAASQEANRLADLQEVAERLPTMLELEDGRARFADPDSEERKAQRRAEREFEAIRRDPVFREVQRMVRLANSLTSWEKVRQQITRRYKSDTKVLTRALAYYKLQRHQLEQGDYR